MKKTILISAFLVLVNLSFGCSCASGQSFCYSHKNYDLSASCVVIGTFPHGISLKIQKIFHGTESRDTIRVWDKGGPYSTCNDSATDASAASLGRVGDTIILALPKIDSLQTGWDVIGDYSTPGFQCDAYRLSVRNNIVTGFISGPPYCYNLDNCLKSYPYDAFLTDFPVKSLSCATWLNTDELSETEPLNYYPNPASDKIIFTSSGRGSLTITNQLGQVIEVVSISENQTQISTGHLSSGVYFLTFETKRSSVSQKLVVQ